MAIIHVVYAVPLRSTYQNGLSTNNFNPQPVIDYNLFTDFKLAEDWKSTASTPQILTGTHMPSQPNTYRVAGSDIIHEIRVSEEEHKFIEAHGGNCFQSMVLSHKQADIIQRKQEAEKLRDTAIETANRIVEKLQRTKKRKAANRKKLVKKLKSKGRKLVAKRKTSKRRKSS